jgi:hypothetical protein
MHILRAARRSPGKPWASGTTTSKGHSATHAPQRLQISVLQNMAG